MGYMVHMAMSHTDCAGCKMMFGNKNKPFDLDITCKHLGYFHLLQHLLIYPTNVVAKYLICVGARRERSCVCPL